MSEPLLSKREKGLFSTHWYSWLRPEPTLNDVLMGCEDREVEGSAAWWQLVPCDVQGIWTELSVVARIVGFRVAAEGNERWREFIASG